MNQCAWKKCENDAGYPYYAIDENNKLLYNHPQFEKIVNSLQEHDNIKYSAYRVGYKLFSLLKQLRVPPLRISAGVFARHQLSLSENSLSLDPAELEAVLADIFFAADKEGLFQGDVDLAVDLLVNLLLNVYDRDRKDPVRVLAAKTLLITLSEDSSLDKWLALANCAADHNGCVSPKRLATLLTHMNRIAVYLGEVDSDHIQRDVDSCFDKNAGMLGVPAKSVADWAVNGCITASWLSVLGRIQSSRVQPSASSNCAACSIALLQVLKFKCSKCNDVYLCEKCYLYDKDLSTIRGHKKSHTVQEIIGEETKSECISFINGMRRFFFCTKRKKKKSCKKGRRLSICDKGTEGGAVQKRKDGRPAIFTSTVGKASGHGGNNPSCVLQDVILQLEIQNRTLKDLSSQLQASDKNPDDALKIKVDLHCSQISTQINRLKILKENMSLSSSNVTTEPLTKDKPGHMQAFDLFSPIPTIEEEKQSKVSELPNRPRVLSLDSGNFSVASKPDNLMTMSGDALKPVVVHATSDSISAVSMQEISSWFNETSKPATQPAAPAQELGQSLCATSQRFDEDLRSVAHSNDKMKELNADLDTVLDRLQQMLMNNFAMDDSCFDNTQLRETANEMEGLLGTLIRGVEQRATLNANKGLV